MESRVESREKSVEIQNIMTSIQEISVSETLNSQLFKMRIDFNPEIHGFQFSNHYIEWAFGPISGKMLCGGMIYAALDYFISKTPIPRLKKVPAIGNPVNNYIYQRQWTAHKNTAYKFTKYWLKKGSHEEFEKLKDFLKLGKAIPICFYNGFGKGHHTLGIAAENGREISFEVYDPNFPNLISHIKAEGNGYRHSLSPTLWKGFFIAIPSPKDI